MEFTVAIPASRASTLAFAVASVRCQTYRDWELLVIVNGADQPLVGSAKHTAEATPNCRVVSIGERGASRARNAALRAATGQFIAMLDDDCVADADWLGVLASCFRQDPGVGLVGGALRAPPASPRRFRRCPAMVPSEAVYDPLAGSGVPPGWDWISAGFAIQRRTAERVGDFDEHLGPGSAFGCAEDTDYKLRLEALGVRVWSTPRAVVHHTFGARDGLLNALRFQRSYARGNGALAGKLTLLGDPRGLEWLTQAKRQWTRGLRHMRYASELPESLVRWLHYRSAYLQIIRNYDIDHRGLLRRMALPRYAGQVS
jgi:GT2 family glycosyltransferase